MSKTRDLEADATGARPDTIDDQANGAGGGPIGAARDVAGTVVGAASDAVARLPEAAASTRVAVEEANRALRAGSDEMLTAGATLSLGLALGLLIGGASRILVVAALIPGAAMLFTLLDRAKPSRTGLQQG
jgi:hypothetical protein